MHRPKTGGLNEKKYYIGLNDRDTTSFPSGPCCINRINTLRIIVFIDFHKASHTANSKYILNTLRKWAISEKLIATYGETKFRVQHRGKISEEFNVQSGVRKGCISSSTLFSRYWWRSSCSFGWRTWTDLMNHDTFSQTLHNADDICLLFHRVMDLDHMAPTEDWSQQN